MSTQDKHEDTHSELNMAEVLREGFSNGKGVIVPQPGMSDAALGALIKQAVSYGKPFVVVPACSDMSQFEKHYSAADAEAFLANCNTKIFLAPQSTRFNPLQDVKDNIDAVMEFLCLAAGGSIAEEVKTTAREVLLPLAETNRDLSMLKAVEAFERVPALHEFAAKLREAALPGAFGKFFNPGGDVGQRLMAMPPEKWTPDTVRALMRPRHEAAD